MEAARKDRAREDWGGGHVGVEGERLEKSRGRRGQRRGLRGGEGETEGHTGRNREKTEHSR